MMNAYNNNEEYSKSISLYEQYNVEHNDVTNRLFIKACGNIGYFDTVKQLINSSITKDVNSHSNEFITTLIDFYGKSDDVDNVLNIFDDVPESERDK